MNFQNRMQNQNLIAQKPILQTSQKECESCGTLLRKQKTQVGRAKQLHGETLQWYDWVMACGNQLCKQYLKLIYSPERLMLKMPNAMYTTSDVLMIESKLKVTKATEIAEKYEINLKQVYRLKKQGKLIMAASKDPEKIRQKIQNDQDGKYYLIIDGTSGMNSQRHIYPCYDGLSGQLIYTKSLTGNTSDDIKGMLKEIEEAYGKPTVISMDQGSSLVKAVEEYWPNIPVHYDHYHFLKNLGKKLFHEETNILKSRLQSIDQSIQRKFQSLPDNEKKMLT